MRNSQDNTNRTLHWIIALCVAAALATGYGMIREGGFSAPLLPLHAGFGVAAGLLTLFRVGLWIGRRATPHPPEARIQMWLRTVVHFLLRLIPIVLLASGMGMIVLSGALPDLVSGSLQDLSAFSNLPPRQLHHIAARALWILIGLHILGAVSHLVAERESAPRSVRTQSM